MKQNDLDRAFESLRDPVEMKGRDEFWDDFRARARLVSREPGETAVREPERFWRWSVAATVAAAAVLGVLFLPVGVPAGIRIESLDVVAQHSAVFILDDTMEDGTIVWISGLDRFGPDEG